MLAIKKGLVYFKKKYRKINLGIRRKKNHNQEPV